MLNLISLSVCGALSSSMMLTNAASLQHSPTSEVENSTTHCSQNVTTLTETSIQLTDADGSSGTGDRRGAGRRN
ncbi:MAG: hypothetical protein WBA13_16160 [Microcoleaceae cyanobacterium]